jgi:trehalose 6-phosphate phosphatase
MAEPLSDIASLQPLLDHPPLGIFSDIDGTLAPIVPRPEDARITPRCHELLEALIDRGVVVCLLTGRPLKTALDMARLPAAAYGANHGLELWLEGESHSPPAVEQYRAAARSVLDETRDLDTSAVIVEDKGPVLSFHYRLADDEQAVRAAILDALAKSPSASRFAVHEGRKVIELRPPLNLNKGTALIDLSHRPGCRSIISIGDDATDIDMFEAAKSLNDVPSAAIAVKSDETPLGLLDAADHWVEGVPGVEWLLSELLNSIRS